jgi:hypothetical protein
VKNSLNASMNGLTSAAPLFRRYGREFEDNIVLFFADKIGFLVFSHLHWSAQGEGMRFLSNKLMFMIAKD